MKRKNIAMLLGGLALVALNGCSNSSDTERSNVERNRREVILTQGLADSSGLSELMRNGYIDSSSIGQTVTVWALHYPNNQVTGLHINNKDFETDIGIIDGDFKNPDERLLESKEIPPQDGKIDCLWVRSHRTNKKVWVNQDYEKNPERADTLLSRLSQKVFSYFTYNQYLTKEQNEP
ncbi:hypothetical protein HYT57_02730 [Candidatus Woesearchaeota archaeon]|nr:hypothetical protein [Candidatus Woesearchaeota archaeon]